MTTILRAMSLGEVLDRTFSLYRRNFVLFAGIAALPSALLLVGQLLALAITRATGDPASLAGGLAMMVSGLTIMGFFVLYLLGICIAQGATVFAVSNVHLERAAAIGDSYGRVKGHIGRIINVVISVGVRIFGGLLLGFLLGAALLGFGAALLPAGLSTAGTAVAIMVGVLTVGIVAVAMIGALYFMMRYTLAVPACVLEDIKAGDAIKRSVHLTRGNLGRLFIVFFLVGVLNQTVGVVFALPAFGLMALQGPTSIWAEMANHFGAFFAGVLTAPILTVATTLIYYDERVRKEAFDLQLMMQTVGPATPPPDQALASGAGNIVG